KNDSCARLDCRLAARAAKTRRAASGGRRIENPLLHPEHVGIAKYSRRLHVAGGVGSRIGIEPMAGIEQDGKIFVGKGEAPQYLTLALTNRHGLVAGATGTGKTVTLQVLAEGLSREGVSVFAADIKSDLSGIAAAGEAKQAFVERAK